MTSPTDKHCKRAAAKTVAGGKWRKNKLRREGSTAKALTLDKPNANEKAQKAKSTKAGK